MRGESAPYHVGRRNMTETDLEDAIFNKLRETSYNYRLSPGFCGRLQTSVRRIRRRWLMKVSAVVLAIVIACLAAVGFMDGVKPLVAQESALIASENHHSETNLSKLAFLGFFRECFKRNKNNKRKEEE